MPNNSDQALRPRGIYLLPNLFTITALFAGFFAIVSAMKGRFDNAAIAIFVAMIMDGLDGRVARLTHTQTPFGAQLDSLSDMVSFGIAPALVIFSYSLIHLGRWGWLAAFIYTMAGALRLARFNTQLGKADKRYFQGLAIPAAAAVVAGIVWVGQDLQVSGVIFDIAVAVITILLGLLMVSSIRYRSFKDLDMKGRVPFFVILLLVLIYVLISIDPPEILLLIFAFYAISGPIGWVWRKWCKRKPRPKNNNDNQPQPPAQLP